MAAGVFLGVVGRVLTEVPSIVEWHRLSFFPSLTGILQKISGPFTSTLGELAFMGLIAAGAISLFRYGSRAVAPMVLVTGLLVAAFYGTWGFAYKYEPLGARLPQLSATGATAEADTAELLTLARQAAQLVASTFAKRSDNKADDATFLSDINGRLNVAFAVLPRDVEVAPIKGIPFGPVKFSRVSYFLSRLQVSGYFSPWLGEAQIDREMPRSVWTRVGSHEKAHQRGFARENEATVVGVLALLSSPDVQSVHAGAIGLFLALDRDVAKADKDARREIWKILPSDVIEDFKAEAEFWERFRGVAGDVSEKVNDTFLKAQGVQTGVQSYSETTRLFLQAIRTPSLSIGRLLTDAGPEPLAQ